MRVRMKGRKHELVDMSKEEQPVIHPKGTRVLARVGNSHEWKPGVIREMHRSGATVKFDGGREGFCYPRNIRLEPREKPDRWKNPEPLVATVAQIARLDDRRPAPKATTEPAESNREPDTQDGSVSEAAPPPARIVTNTTTQRFVTPIGVVFQTHRRRLGWSQSTLASQIRISSGQVSDIELGEKLPDDDVLMAFAEATGAEIGDLIDRRQQSASGQVMVKQREAQLPVGTKSAVSGLSKPAIEEVDATVAYHRAQAEAAKKAHEDPALTRYVAETADQVNGVPGTIAVEKFQVFLEHLLEIAQIPQDREGRHEYLEKARGLFWANGVRLK